MQEMKQELQKLKKGKTIMNTADGTKVGDILQLETDIQTWIQKQEKLFKMFRLVTSSHYTIGQQQISF